MDDETPLMEDLRDMLGMIAQHEKGERFLNCVLQRFAARVNQLPLRELAVVVRMRGDANIVFKPNRARLEAEFALKDAAQLTKADVLRRSLGDDPVAEGRLRADVAPRLRKLLADATLQCAAAV